jgi:CBS domain containing-hemolysin-like protein
MSAYFSATETALSTFNRIRMKNMAEKGNKKAALVIKLSEKYDALISTILIGNNIVNILASSLTTILFIDLLKGGSLAEWSSAIATAILTIIILTFGEISPKTVAKKKPETFAMFAAPLINALVYIFTPLTFIFGQLQKLLAKAFKNDDENAIIEEELSSMVEEAEEDGSFDKEESDLIKSAIEFADLAVSDIFTPRIDITAVSRSATRDEIDAVFTDSGFSRLPVFEGDIDHVVGILYYKDFYTTDFKDIGEILKPVLYVAMTQKINDLMKELQVKQKHMAIVIDEFGSTAGLVTLEDALEEIVGEIWDEHDEKVIEIQKVGEKQYVVSGKASVSKLFDELDIDDEIEAQTVNGWSMNELEKIPEVGDVFETEKLRCEVIETDGKIIGSLSVTDLRESDDDEDGDKSKPVQTEIKF